MDIGDKEQAKYWLNRAASQGLERAKDVLSELSETDLDFMESAMGRNLKRIPSAGPILGSRRDRGSTQSEGAIRPPAPSRSISHGLNTEAAKAKNRPSFHKKPNPTRSSAEKAPQQVETKQKPKPEVKCADEASFLVETLGWGLGALLGGTVGALAGVKASYTTNTREDLCVGIGVGSGLFLGGSMGSYASRTSLGRGVIFASLACLGTYTATKLLPKLR